MIRTRELRDEQGLTLDDLARAAGIHRQTVWSYEHGKASPSIDRAYRLAQALGVSLDALYVHDADAPTREPADGTNDNDQAAAASPARRNATAARLRGR